MEKHDFPFKLGTTSYIIPDHILPNARFLTPLVDDIELVLFESPDHSNIPDDGQIAELRELGQANGCGYTVHLPTDRKAGSPDAAEREAWCENAFRIFDCCGPLDPHAWIVHLEGIGPDASGTDRDTWHENVHGVLERLAGKILNPDRLAIENLAYPWTWHRDVVRDTGCSLCCDLGHLWLHRTGDWEDRLAAMLPETRVIHLHGEVDGKDHLDLAKADPVRLKKALALVDKAGYNGVITLEIFNRSDFEGSCEAVKETWEQLRS